MNQSDVDYSSLYFPECYNAAELNHLNVCQEGIEDSFSTTIRIANIGNVNFPLKARNLVDVAYVF